MCEYRFVKKKDSCIDLYFYLFKNIEIQKYKFVTHEGRGGGGW